MLIDISASWCPTCKAQAPIIGGLSTQEKYSSFVILEVDFDEQKDIVRALGARSQSTLIVFKGAQEIDRSVGSTDPVEIEALLAKALNAS
ncbi:MAG: thioredoxin family protein [Hyphomicrobiales bacterium]|nr:thioredoxin family protein [Hyphomicrobiales bacterium]